jgi:hypothetical protein
MKTNHILIEVSGGVAEVTLSTAPVIVHLMDWDNIKESGGWDRGHTQTHPGVTRRDFARELKMIRERIRGYNSDN